MARLGLAAGGAEAEAASAEQETVKLALSQLLVTKGVSENLQDKILLLAGGSANLAARKDKAGSYLFPTLHHALPVVLKLAELVGTNERHGDGAASPHQSAHPPRYGQINTVELTHTTFSFNLTHLQRSQDYEKKIEQHSQHWSSRSSTTAALVLAACGAPAAPAAQAPAAPAGPVVNSVGVELPADAAPLDQQVMRYPYTEATWLTWDASVYDENEGDVFAWADSCLRPDKNYEPQPNLCTEWSLSEDGLTWTFKMDPKRLERRGAHHRRRHGLHLPALRPPRLRLRVVLRHGQHRELGQGRERRGGARGTGRQEGRRLHFHDDHRPPDPLPVQDHGRRPGWFRSTW